MSALNEEQYLIFMEWPSTEGIDSDQSLNMAVFVSFPELWPAGEAMRAHATMAEGIEFTVQWIWHQLKDWRAAKCLQGVPAFLFHPKFDGFGHSHD